MAALLITIIITTYIILILALWLGWEKALPEPEADLVKVPVSIIMAVRNEAENIALLLNDLSKQSYPNQLLEIIIVDDHSSDKTVESIKHFIKDDFVKFSLIQLEDSQGKKAAIARAIDHTTHDIILSTDGDCRAGTDWVKSMISCFSGENVQLVSGPVRLFPADTLFARMQSIEFSSLICAGAATLTLGWPTMANAANFAFRKAAFKKVSGHLSPTISSGDDVFLLHKIAGHYNNGVKFCRDQRAIIDTIPAASLSSFYQQRKRWAGKWQFYQDIPTKLLAVFIFLVNLTVLLLPVLALVNVVNWVLVANLFVVKFAFEFWYLRAMQKFFKTTFKGYEFIVLAIIYPVYVTFMAIAGLFGEYQWKGRYTK
jgi:poly-beta-1,6-N-acetyl-D-glucosamine synthase